MSTAQDDALNSSDSNSRYTYLRAASPEYIDAIYAQYLDNPSSVDSSWRYLFEGIEIGHESSEFVLPEGSAAGSATDVKFIALREAFRQYGKFQARINPLQESTPSQLSLQPETHGLSPADLEQSFQGTPIKQLIENLRAAYCGTIACELEHVTQPMEREWLRKKVESLELQKRPELADRKFYLKRLTDSEAFEKFLHTRYVAQKRFSIEGSEALIPMMDVMIEKSCDFGVTEVIVGMAHRGRLNVLHNIFGKNAEYMFTEFEGNYTLDPNEGEGDVKYHKGWKCDYTTRQGKKARLSLAFNPSHLETVNPVMEGMARARQDLTKDTERAKVLPIVMHGDAAFAGQGLVYETLNLSLMPGFSTGGTVHIVINNQVGFTTDPSDSRSTSFCSDLAKYLEAPIFHVNGDDPEACAALSALCTEYRQKFKKDIFIDLVSYRRHGHNEGDEPSFTQPLLYKKIKAHPSPREVYAKRLISENSVSDAEAQSFLDLCMERFSIAQKIAKEKGELGKQGFYEGEWKNLKKGKDLFASVTTQLPAETLLSIGQKINTLPAGFVLHSKLQRFFEARIKTLTDGKGIDWGNGEALAYASLLAEGHTVRITGQDVKRGTFTHRHAVVFDFETGKPYVTYSAVAKAPFEIYNSVLSEAGVLGFEFGYSLEAPNALTVWEAQFGDFSNSAQVIIDQYVSAAESKWGQASGLTMLLPHGYEGQGPEHSSARFERFLQLCGRQNMFVCNVTTPAQIFHVLRRQVKASYRKPLIIMSPKSLLRHPHAISNLSEFTQAGFQEVINDAPAATAPQSVQRVVLCTGKVYYDLLAEKTQSNRNDIALVRVEQLHPWPETQLAKIMDQYSGAKEIFWAQEEPKNMGAWSFVLQNWTGKLPIQYRGRATAASPAVGSPKQHEKEQKAIIAEVFAEIFTEVFKK